MDSEDCNECGQYFCQCPYDGELDFDEILDEKEIEKDFLPK